MSGVPYLGSRIVLISKSEIRYEGTLYTIDTTNSTVALQNVRSFGTEGRKDSGRIPPSNEVFDYIIFRGTDIKDLHVCETPVETPHVALSAASAPVSRPLAALPVQAAAAPPPPSWGANPSQAASSAFGTRTPVAKGAPTASAAAPAAVPRGGRSQPGTGAHISTRASRGAGTKHGPTGDLGDFDFEKMLAGFSKVTLDHEPRCKLNAPTAYDKNASFFDALDEEIAEAGPRKVKHFLEEMRKVRHTLFTGVVDCDACPACPANALLTSWAVASRPTKQAATQDT